MVACQLLAMPNILIKNGAVSQLLTLPDALHASNECNHAPSLSASTSKMHTCTPYICLHLASQFMEKQCPFCQLYWLQGRPYHCCHTICKHCLCTAGALLQAFPALVEGESKQHRHMRMAAGETAWAALSQNAQVVAHYLFIMHVQSLLFCAIARGDA